MRKLWPGLLASAAAALFAALSWPRLPERVASHWDLHGAVDGTTSRFWLVLMPPVIAVVLAGILTIAPKIDPKRRNFPLHAGAYWVVANAILLFLALVHVLVIGYNLGWPFQFQAVMMPGLGLLFIVIGNVLTRVRPNWIFGIRTPGPCPARCRGASRTASAGTASSPAGARGGVRRSPCPRLPS